MIEAIVEDGPNATFLLSKSKSSKESERAWDTIKKN
jgi:hypothetical protein